MAPRAAASGPAPGRAAAAWLPHASPCGPAPPPLPLLSGRRALRPGRCSPAAARAFGAQGSPGQSRPSAPESAGSAHARPRAVGQAVSQGQPARGVGNLSAPRLGRGRVEAGKGFLGVHPANDRPSATPRLKALY
ncbi:translation initiation factor IF-2 isoform X3 [Equus quagga]|uniref:translation initiation factor IF-2 isoform X3 n=1 Tax=Equus quagga TaxID=89248 RepID=UPI001EE18854|nr:translation initiation factor IF-2 isoform X3 [Equus quagga]